MSKKNERTAKDERQYDAQLRREETVKTEVIVELREQNKLLLKNNIGLLRALIEAQDALRVYRKQILEYFERAAATDSHCVPGCTRHTWDTVEGWQRKAQP